MRFSPGLSAALLALLAGACADAGEGDVDTAAAAGGVEEAPAARAAERTAAVAGFRTPESVKFDSEQDVYFVSNIDGNPSRKDGNGYIARIDAADSARAVTTAIRSGQNGVTLNAPKGMAIVGDTLWVADIDVLRGFNRTTGAPVATIQFPRPVYFLNDVAAGPDGALYVTDTGIQFDASGGMTAPSKGQIFRVEGRRATLASSDTSFNAPNGIAWDEGRRTFVVGSFNGPTLFSWAPDSGAPRAIATGPGQYDGIEIVDGRVIVTSWADSSLHVLERGADSLTRIVAGVASPADIGVDSRRSLLLVPLFTGNAVELWTIPGVGAGAAPASPAPGAADTARP